MNLSKMYLFSLLFIAATGASATAAGVPASAIQERAQSPLKVAADRYPQLGKSDAVATPTNSLLNVAQNLNQRGAELLAAGKPEQALADWQQAHKIYTQLKDANGIIGTKINQAQALQALGFYRQARTTLEQIDRSLQTQPKSALKVRSLLALGNCLRALRILESPPTSVNGGGNIGAKTTLELALKIAKELEDKTAIDQINLSLANTLQLLGGEQEQTAIDIYQQIGNDAEPLIRVKAKVNLYRLQSAQKIAPNTIAFLGDIEQILQPIAPSRSTVYAYVNLAETIKKNQESTIVDREILTRTARLLGTAIAQSRTIKDRRGEAQALGSLASLYALTGQEREAKNLTRQALAIAEDLPAPDLAYRLHWQLAKTITASNPTAKEIQVATAAYSRAISHLKTLRNDLNAIDAELQFSFRDSVEPVYREYVNLLLRDDERVSADNLIKARDIIESLQIAELENFLRQGCLDTYTVPLDKIDRTAAVIYPIILPDRVATIVSLPGQELRYRSQKITAEDMDKTINELRRIIITEANFTPEKERNLKQNSKQIYDLLLGSVADDIQRTKTQTLVFVLDGNLRNIPMSVLYDGDKYLVEKYNIALTPGLQLVPPQNTGDRLRSQALLGGISQGRSGYSSLPNVEPEIESISRLVPHQKLLNQNFNKQLVETNLVNNSAPIVHLATHGQFSSKPEDTFILTWDNRLDLERLSNLLRERNSRSSSALELLVLSACETATGDNRATLGLAGVAIRARAKSTIASLWAVNDESTQNLMVNLYQNMLGKNLSKGEALRRAQQSLLRDPKYRSPYYWAPFVLVGNWQ